jgi:hypothetical protein
MRHSQQTAIFGIVFWVLFLGSIGLVLNDHWLWLQVAWLFLGWAFAAVASVFSIVGMFKNRNSSNYFSGPARSLWGGNYYLPHWMMWVVADEEQYEKYLQRRRLTASDRNEH